MTSSDLDALKVPCPLCRMKAGRKCISRERLAARAGDKPHDRRRIEAERQARLLDFAGAPDIASALEVALETDSARGVARRADLPYDWVRRRAKDHEKLPRRFPPVKTVAEAEGLLEGIGEHSDEAVAAAAKAKTGITIHPESVGRIRRRLGIPRPPMPEADPPPSHRIAGSTSRDPHYLTHRKYPAPILAFLRAHGPAFVTEIRGHLGANRNSIVAKALGTMSEPDRGWVRRDDDGRWALTGDLTEDFWEEVERSLEVWPFKER